MEMEKDQRLKKALDTLEGYVLELAGEAGEGPGYGEALWQELKQSQGLLQELAYFHEYGKFLDKYQVEGYTLTDVLIWQVDHFKLYMDRPEEMNRYRRQRLLLSAFETMLGMEKDPAPYIEKIRGETGQDIQGR